jgi:hypothetical protein
VENVRRGNWYSPGNNMVDFDALLKFTVLRKSTSVPFEFGAKL